MPDGYNPYVEQQRQGWPGTVFAQPGVNNIWNDPNYLARLEASTPRPAQPVVPVGYSVNRYTSTVDPNVAQYNAEQDRLNARGQALELNDPNNAYRQRYNFLVRQQTEAKNPSTPQRQAVSQANTGVLDASGRQSMLQRDFYRAQQQDEARKYGNAQTLWGAEDDVQDATAVARMQQQQAVTDANRRLFGLAPEIAVRGGVAGQLASGLRPEVRSRAAVVKEQQGREDVGADYGLQTIRNNVALSGLDVTDARLREGYAEKALRDWEAELGYGVDEARLDLNEQLGEADYNLDMATYRGELAKRPPDARSVEYTGLDGQGAWVSPEDLSLLKERDEAIKLGLGGRSEDEIIQLLRAGTISAAQARGALLAAGRTPADALNVINQATGRGVSGSVLEAQTPQSLLDQMGQTPLDFNTSVVTTRAEFVRRFIRQGYTQQQAEEAAQQLINAELAKRYEQQQRADRAAGGGGGALP